MELDHKVTSIKFEDTLKLSPFEKATKLDRFPWMMIIHILLLIFTTSQAILIVGNKTQYSRSQERIFYNLFIDDVIFISLILF